MKYSTFMDLIATMDFFGYDYKKEILEIEKRRTALSVTNGTTGSLGLQDHVKTMVYAQLSNNRPWEPIAKNARAIDKIFLDFHIDKLKKAESNLRLLSAFFDDSLIPLTF